MFVETGLGKNSMLSKMMKDSEIALPYDRKY